MRVCASVTLRTTYDSALKVCLRLRFEALGGVRQTRAIRERRDANFKAWQPPALRRPFWRASKMGVSDDVVISSQAPSSGYSSTTPSRISKEGKSRRFCLCASSRTGAGSGTRASSPKTRCSTSGPLGTPPESLCPSPFLAARERRPLRRAWKIRTPWS